MNAINLCLTRRHVLAAAVATLAGCKTDSRNAANAASACAKPPAAGPRLSNRLVCVDATTLLDAGARARTLDLTVGWARAGDRFQITSFGGKRAAWDGTAAMIEVDGDEQAGDAKRWTQAPNEIQRMLACARATREQLRAALSAALARQDGSTEGHSPIFETVMNLAQNWPSSAASGRALLLVSDGVQFSNAIKFANRGSLTVPSPAELLRKLRKLDLLPQFRDLSVIHLGLGVGADVMAGAAAHSADLKAVWKAYWTATGARLLVMGTPMPLDAFPPVVELGLNNANRRV